MEIAKAKITAKRQITIPKMVTRELNLEEGDDIAFLIEDKTIRVIKNPKDLMEAMERFVAAGKETPDILQKLKKSRQEW